MAGPFQVMWGTTDGDFEQPAVLQGNHDEPLIIHSAHRGLPPQRNGHASLRSARPEAVGRAVDVLGAAPATNPRVPRGFSSSAAQERVIDQICTRPAAVDLNADGKLDILIGDNGAVHCPAEGLSLAQAREARAEGDPEVTSAVLVEHFKTQSEFTSYELAGFVWVMHRK